MKIYTKTGDTGKTGLFGGKRVSKDDLRIEAYGTIDELNGLLGIAVSKMLSERIKKDIVLIQNELFNLGADLATPLDENKIKISIPRISDTDITRLEKLIDNYQKELPELRVFILPGGLEGSSILHLSRTVCRRAERRIVELSNTESIGEAVLKYINRLSDLLFVLARFENYSNNHPEVEWKSIN
ncbi:MAG: cob(I)yrinic acid a,c-diamide adenosyltransferase [Ignavibacteriae bacterium]|nr:cob(I)yrinic acid a,c-diamide adenosyltransferase [Ignavibacteriota bacterium]NOG96667.1 cob(I)yrinic acid a,c-diamide adenosyltransferase [Ignavibacteriota bacterium]